MCFQTEQVTFGVEECHVFVLPDGAVREWFFLFLTFLPNEGNLKDLMLEVVIPILRIQLNFDIVAFIPE